MQTVSKYASETLIFALRRIERNFWYKVMQNDFERFKIDFRRKNPFFSRNFYNKSFAAQNHTRRVEI